MDCEKTREELLAELEAVRRERDELALRVALTPSGRGTGQLDEPLSRSIFRTSAVGIAIAPLPERRLVRTNPALQAMLGYTGEELAGMTMAELNDPAEQASTRPQIEALLAGEQHSARLEKRLRRKDGRHLWVAVVLSLLRDENGRPEAFLGLMEDISERKQAEETLRRREARLAEAQQVGQVGSWEWDMQNETLSWSDEMYRIAGLEPQSVPVSREFFVSCVLPEDRHLIGGNIERMRGGQAPAGVDYRIRRADGEVRTLNTRAEVVCAPDGTPLRVVGVAYDVTERRAVEEQIRRRETQLAEAQAIAHLGSWEWTEQSPVLSWSDELYRIFGFAPQERPITVEDFRGFIHPADRDLVAENVRRSLALGLGVAYEFRIFRADGELRTVYCRAEVVRDEQRGLLRLRGTTQDVTERRRLMEALRANEVKLRAIVEHASDAIYIKDLAGRHLFANEAAAELFGLTVAELLERSVHELFDAATLRAVELEDQHVLVHGGPLGFERTLRTREGQEFEFLFTKYPYYAPDGSLAGIVGIGHDITQRKHAEAALRRSNALLRSQLEASIDGILVVDEHRRTISYNQRFLEIWQVPESVMASGDDLYALDFVSDNICDAEAFNAKIDYLHAHPLEPSRDEIVLKDGRVLDRYSAPCLSPQGEYYGRIWYFRDITEPKRLAAALQAQNERLEVLNRLKVNFVNAVSHELRAPLTSIMGYAEFLEEIVAEPPQPELIDFVEQILKGAKRMRSLVEDLQNVTLIEVGAFRLKLQQADFAAKAREIVESVRPEADRAQLGLVLELPEALPRVTMDPLRVGQVLSNLLANAIKFTPAGGQVRLSARAEGDRLLCEVSDSGQGIAEEDQPMVFQRYAQLESGLKKGGSGLGLNICKALVEEHGGVIGLRSRPGEGSTFWFALPLTGPVAKAETPARQEAPI